MHTPTRGKSHDLSARRLVDELPELVDADKHEHSTEWNNEEAKALVNYFLFRGYLNKWPFLSDSLFWKSAADFVHKTSQSSIQRTGII